MMKGFARGTAAATTSTTRQGRRKALGALLGLAGLGTSTTLAWQLWREWVPQWQTAVSTPPGQIGRLLLPDCGRRFKSEPPGRSQFEPGVEAGLVLTGCG